MIIEARTGGRSPPRSAEIRVLSICIAGVLVVFVQIYFLSSCGKWGEGHLSDLLHPVESGSGLEPGDLLLVEGVVQGDVHALAVGGHGGGHGL